MADLHATLRTAVEAGQLLESSHDNILFLHENTAADGYERAAIAELVAGGQWTEINDRFYQTLKFGTGGLRGRSIGKIITAAERGAAAPHAPPQFPAAGTNALNFFNISRATQGLCRYLLRRFPGTTPALVIAHDPRYFSRAFAEKAADTASRMGVRAFLFREQRSTPELSFAVRHLGAQAGVMITASHNPPHDNGFKAYFDDGGQLVEPHASAIIAEVNNVDSGDIAPSSLAANPAGVELVGAEVDKAYLDALMTLVLDPDVFRNVPENFRLVFTPIHGTGIETVPPMLDRMGVRYSVVPQQAAPDGGFPTVKSPNPENAEALSMAMDKAKFEEAAFLAGTDPDADRMGVAVRAADGTYEILSGNQIGSILARYRIERFFDQGVLTPANASRAALIKTFVTTDLQKDIAAAAGLKCVETLTGFKYIGEKLKDYAAAAGGRGELDFKAWRSRLLEKSTFFVFGGEESYGYSGGDYVRDKDANAAVLMFTEAAAWCAARGRTLLDYLDEIYLRHGFYAEKLGTLTFEGAEGAGRIQRLLKSYQENRPAEWGGRAVEGLTDFAADNIQDVDGKPIPKENMLIFSLAGGYRVAVRGSGTEPKIKYYFFGRGAVPAADSLPGVKTEVRAELDRLWEWTRQDADTRAG